MQNEDAQKLAEKIAALISNESAGSDLASIQRSLASINERLTRLEASPHPETQITRSSHPSQDRFEIAEAIVDSLYDRSDKEKACTFEPNAKPCDHCSMCSSRGF